MIEPPAMPASAVAVVPRCGCARRCSAKAGSLSCVDPPALAEDEHDLLRDQPARFGGDVDAIDFQVLGTVAGKHGVDINDRKIQVACQNYEREVEPADGPRPRIGHAGQAVK